MIFGLLIIPFFYRFYFLGYLYKSLHFYLFIVVCSILSSHVSHIYEKNKYAQINIKCIYK